MRIVAVFGVYRAMLPAMVFVIAIAFLSTIESALWRSSWETTILAVSMVSNILLLSFSAAICLPPFPGEELRPREISRPRDASLDKDIVDQPRASEPDRHEHDRPRLDFHEGCQALRVGDLNIVDHHALFLNERGPHCVLQFHRVPLP